MLSRMVRTVTSLLCRIYYERGEFSWYLSLFHAIFYVRRASYVGYCVRLVFIGWYFLLIYVIPLTVWRLAAGLHYDSGGNGGNTGNIILIHVQYIFIIL